MGVPGALKGTKGQHCRSSTFQTIHCIVVRRILCFALISLRSTRVRGCFVFYLGLGRNLVGLQKGHTQRSIFHSEKLASHRLWRYPTSRCHRAASFCFLPFFPSCFFFFLPFLSFLFLLRPLQISCCSLLSTGPGSRAHTRADIFFSCHRRSVIISHLSKGV